MTNNANQMLNTISGTATLKQHISLCAASQVPLLILGGYGIGKTEVVLQTFEDTKKYHCEPITGSELNPTDISGVLVPDMKNKIAEFLPLSLIKNLNNAHKAGLTPVLIIDELPTADQAVMANFLELINHNRAGTFTIPKNTIKIAMGNPPEFAPDIFSLSPVMGNRLSIVNYAGPSKTEWLEHAQPYPAIAGLIMQKPHLLNDPNPQDFTSPTPRSWSLLSRMLTELDSNPDNAYGISKPGTYETHVRCAASLVGESAAMALMTFIVWNSKLPNIKDIIRAPETTAIPDELPAQYLLGININRAVSDMAGNDKVTKKQLGEYTKRIITYIERLELEVQMIMVNNITQHIPETVKLPAVKSILSKLGG